MKRALLRFFRRVLGCPAPGDMGSVDHNWTPTRQTLRDHNRSIREIRGT